VDFSLQQQPQIMAQPQSGGGGGGGGGNHHPYYAASPTSPAPGQTFNNMYDHHHNGQRPGYPSSISSNDPLLTQEEADLKRLRNTAASARFRAKKKRREASLERNAHEKKAKLESLETRIRDLEAENQWLKDLIMEKNAVRTARLERKGHEQKDGVGT